MEKFFESFRSVLNFALDTGLCLVAVSVLASILFGTDVPFVGDVTANLVAFIDTLGDNGLVGLIALVILVYLFQRHNQH